MVDTTAVLQSFSDGVSQGSFILLIVLLLAVLFGLIGLILYKRSFKVDIIIVRLGNGAQFKTGLKGKFYIKGKGNEYRFKIFQARKHKLLYNEEAVTPENTTQEENFRGQIKQLVILSPNDQGYLTPMKLTPEMYSYQKKEFYKDTTGAEKEKIVTVSTPVLKAKYGSVDVAWFATESNKYREMFDTRTLWDKWGLIIVACVMLLTLGAFMWNTSKNVEVAQSLAVSAEVIRDALMHVAQNGTAITTQPINSIVLPS